MIIFSYHVILNVHVNLTLYGHKLLSLCKKLNLYITNSRVGADKGVGDKPYKDVSVVDYLILSSKLFPFVKEFKIEDFEQLYSDCHCLILFVFYASWPPFTTNESTGDSNTEMYMKWDSNRKLYFVNCVNWFWKYRYSWWNLTRWYWWNCK